MKHKLGSLFDGSGGFPLAGSLCGIEPVWASEVEPYPIAVTRSRFPGMKHLGDISKINGAEIEPVDIITFGSPCQDLSVAGKRAGLKHEANGDEETTRSGLFMEAVRIIKEMRRATNGVYPRFALWENVPGAFSSNKGEDFRIVLEELIKIVEPTAVMPEVPKNGWPYADSYCGDGWSLAYRVFDAQYWGVPQRRRRIHLVLDLRGERARQVSFEREGVRGYFETGRTPWQETAGDAENCSGATDREGVPYLLKIRSGCEGGGKCALIQTDMSATLATNNDQYLFQPMSIREENWAECDMKNALRAGESKSSHVVLQLVPNILLYDQGGQQINVRTYGKGIGLDLYNFSVSGDVAVTLNAGSGTADAHAGPSVCVPIKECYGLDHVITTGGNCTAQGSCVYKDVQATLKAGGVHAVCYAMQAFGDYKDCGVASGLKARDYKDATDLVVSSGDPPAVRYIVRRLTPTECARLQGFPDKWGHPDAKEDFTDEEYRFWLEVRNTHATVIGGKEAKDYTKAQMLTWYNKLHTDSAEYKMWGNGIALPPALYLLQGMTDVLKGSDYESQRNL